MGVVVRESFVRAGGWRTLATLVNVDAEGRFRTPAGARIKLRYGVGWFGFDRQKQTLDGETLKRLKVGSTASLSRARMQMSVTTDAHVTWEYAF